MRLLMQSDGSLKRAICLRIRHGAVWRDAAAVSLAQNPLGAELRMNQVAVANDSVQ